MVRWLKWRPPDAGFEIRALAVWGRARYLSVTEAPHNTDFYTWMGKKHFLFLSNPPGSGTELGTLEGWKVAVLTTTLGPRPLFQGRILICIRCSLKHTTTLFFLFSLSDHYIRNREWRVNIDQVKTNYHGPELLIMRDPHYDWMYFKSIKTLGVLHS